MADTIILYHGAGCRDGFCAAWLMHRYYPNECEFYPVNYGEPPPDVKDKQIFVLDFSYPRETLEQMHRDAAELICLDHHASAEKELAGLDYCTFDMNRSGAQMTWDWLRSNLQPTKTKNGYFGRTPWLVNYTADRDLWVWKLRDSEEINAAVRSYPLTFDVWDSLSIRGGPKTLVPEGRAIIRAEGQIVAEHVARSREVDWDGYRVRIVNATCLFSEIAGELAKDHPFGAVWFEVDGRRKWSLRSRPSGLCSAHRYGENPSCRICWPKGYVDLSVFARKCGGDNGGGHPKAAGFTEPLDIPLPLDAVAED